MNSSLWFQIYRPLMERHLFQNYESHDQESAKTLEVSWPLKETFHSRFIRMMRHKN